MPQHLRKAFDGVLGRRVEALEGETYLAAIGREVDDVALASGTHMGQHRLADGHDAQGVDVHHGAEFGHGGFLDRPAVAHPGVVDQHVDLAKSIQRGLHCRLDLVVAGHVELRFQQQRRIGRG